MLTLLAGTALIAFGIAIAVNASAVAQWLCTFYGSYPLVRYAGKKQLTPRPGFVIAFGCVFILFGLAGLYAGL